MLKQSKKIRDVIEISYNDTFIILAGIAQLVERLLAKQKVAGSNPVSRSIFNKQGGIMSNYIRDQLEKLMLILGEKMKKLIILRNY